MIFDTHIHLFSPKYEIEIEQMLNHASEVSLFLVVGYDLQTSIEATELAKKYPCIYASIGIHPHDAESVDEDSINKLEELAKSSNKVVAIGEIGLDYYYKNDTVTKQVQKRAFIKQIELANRLDLPVVIHTRDSTLDTVTILLEHKVKNNGILHCYSGEAEVAKKMIEEGYYISFGGPITYTNFKKMDVVKSIPLNRILVETDGPYLAPHPYRGKVNLPSYISLIVEKMASVFNLSKEEMAHITKENGRRILKIK